MYTYTLIHGNFHQLASITFEHCPYQGIIKEASGMLGRKRSEANTKTYCCRTSRTVFWEDQAVSQATVAE